MMRTTIEVQDHIINDIMVYYEAKSKTEAVNKALTDWVKHLKRQKLLDLMGKIDIEDFTEEMKRNEIEDMKRYE